jgi:predicted TIM-barrel fold metal-dependent hydrolase
VAALICHGVFDRFPTLRVATIESGSEWVQPLLKKLGKAWSMTPGAFAADPVAALRSHVWVAPYYEDDIRSLADALGSDHVLFGSDWPHAEGLADPHSFVDDLVGFSEEEIRLIMRDNAEALSRPPA